MSHSPIVVEHTLPILAHKPDAALHLHRCFSLASAGAIRQLADADLQAVQRLLEESPVTASLSSLAACRSCGRSLMLLGTAVHLRFWKCVVLSRSSACGLLLRLLVCCTDLTCELSSQLLAEIVAGPL